MVKWINAGAPWPDGEILSPKPKTVLPRWDAPPNPETFLIEAFPNKVTLESAANFHRVIVIAQMKDAFTQGEGGKIQKIRGSRKMW